MASSVYQEFLQSIKAMDEVELAKFWAEFNSAPRVGPPAQDLIDFWDGKPPQK